MRNLFHAPPHLRCHPEIANPVRSNLEASFDRAGAMRVGDGSHRKLFPPPRPAAPPLTATRRVLGGLFRFESKSRDLIDLVEAAYGRLPTQTLPGVTAEFRVELRLLPRRANSWTAEPPAPRIRRDGDVFRAEVGAADIAAVEPDSRLAGVTASVNSRHSPCHVHCW